MGNPNNIAYRPAPVQAGERIVSLDVLRGVAILGILILNIQTFSMIIGTYDNPTSFPEYYTGVNKWIWDLSYIFARAKFMTIFSLMFGAGVILMTSRVEKKGLRSAGVHYRRMLWLIIFGAMHAYLLWYGDILFSYGICALLVFVFRKKKPKTLIILGMSFYLISFLLALFFNWSMPYWPEEAINEQILRWQPSMEMIQNEISNYQSGWLDQLNHRIPTSIMIQTMGLLVFVFWNVTGLMLIGMALYKLGILSAERSKSYYIKMIVPGLVIGFSLTSYGLFNFYKHDWSWEYSLFLGREFNYWGSLFVGLGYIGVIMLICKSSHFKRFKNWLAPVGRMALTNYLIQTLICTTIFYGHGLGLFSKVERPGQIMIVIAIWIIQIIYSNIWLKHFRFGPFEWLWRSLTYWKIQPFKLTHA
ncbi:MAG: DUF418 domain-containing protein [Bacteroidales bacterium]|nr:DUF418 domain-containing protein [Bacteroidales bacterium]